MKLIYTIICISIYSGISFAQSCDPTLSLDDITNPGVYNIASITEDDGIRNGPDYGGATIFYPTNGTGPFPSITIVPGYVSPQSSIQSWGPFLASHGIVTMTIGTNSIFEQPESRKDALLDAIITLKEENTRTGSPLIGNIDFDKIAVGGWSMGGGGAQLAAVQDPSIKAIMALCPWLSNPSAADLNHEAPILIFSAELDAIAPHAAHADVHYDLTPTTTDKLIFEINNAGHTVANNPTGASDDIGKIALSWLQQYLIGDDCYCPLYLDVPSTASKYETNIVCPITTSINEISNEISFNLFPNPTSTTINLEIKNIDKTSYEILSLTGASISSGTLVNQITTINVQDLSAGIYIMNVITGKTTERTKFIIQ